MPGWHVGGRACTAVSVMRAGVGSCSVDLWSLFPAAPGAGAEACLHTLQYGIEQIIVKGELWATKGVQLK